MSLPHPRRIYPAAFREQAVEFYLSVADYRSVKQVAAELGIGYNTLHRWIKAITRPEPDAIPSEGERAELIRLRRENKILKEELEISKKAAAFFARTGDRNH